MQKHHNKRQHSHTHRAKATLLCEDACTTTILLFKKDLLPCQELDQKKSATDKLWFSKGLRATLFLSL